jgi:small GTP-binding protein
MTPAVLAEEDRRIAMDLRDYERAKFELADVLRAIATLAKGRPRADQDRIEDLFARLAEDRFNLVVVGRFSRGKTSLMNAILGTDRLPTGIVPLTSVITTVAYGSTERVIVNYEGQRLPNEVPLALLPEYITQHHNPGNVRRVRLAEVQLPSEILRRGFHFVDTPGMGSPIPENTATTTSFLPEADAFLLVTSYESPLSDEEVKIIRAAASSQHRIFIVLNKHDTVGREERDEAVRYVSEYVATLLGQGTDGVFSVSARDGLAAKREHDAGALAASGIEALEAALTRFLLADKSAEFLVRMCERLTDLALDFLPSTEAAQFVQRLRLVADRVSPEHVNVSPRRDDPVSSRQSDPVPPARACEICQKIVQASYDGLRHFQYDLGVSPEVQQDHAKRGGLCGLHTWQYAFLASSHGICTGYPLLLERLSARLHEIANEVSTTGDLSLQIGSLSPTSETCVQCRICAEAETEVMSGIVGRFAANPDDALASLSTICIPHLQVLVGAIQNPETGRRLVDREASILDRIAEDMRRYAVKYDGIRRFLASEEETKAGHSALTAVAGLRNVHMAPREI